MKLHFYIVAILFLQVNVLCSQTWSYSDKKVAPVRRTGEGLGSKLAIHNDYALIGSSLSSLTNNGTCYLYERNGNGEFEFRQELNSLDTSTGVIKSPLCFSFLEYSIKGDYAITGCPSGDWDSIGGLYHDAGSAYIFERQTDGTWIQSQKLGASDREKNDHFGYDVSISGEYAAVSSSPGPYPSKRLGTVYLFKRNSLGQWNEIQKINSPTSHGFGFELHLNGDRLIIGTERYVAYVYEQNVTGYWAPTSELLFGDTSLFSGGNFVQIQDDFAFVDGPRDSVYIFKRDQTAKWQLNQKIGPSNHPQYGSGYFGWTLSVSGDHLIVGSTRYAYIFHKDANDNWIEIARLNSADSTDRFGSPVVISGNTSLVGACNHSYDENGNNYLGQAGAAFVYETEFAGVPEQKRTSDVSIYPNPASEFIRIDSQHPLTQYTIFNQLGVITMQGNCGNNEVDISVLNRGLYHIVLKDQNGKSFSARFVK